MADKKNYWALGWDPKPTDLKKEYCYNPLLLKIEFSKNYLTEKDSCWILGNHMGVGENRRNKNALVYEGTFRTLVIKNNLKKFS